MKKTILIIAIVTLVLAAYFSENKTYALIGCLLTGLILLIFIIIESYRYNNNNKEISNTCFTLGRDNLINQLVGCALFIRATVRDVSNNMYTPFDNIDVIFTIFCFVFIAFQLYIVIFHPPKLSIKGFLCSDGEFIPFSKIKSIKWEDGIMLAGKKLLIDYDEKLQKTFKVSTFDYENIKNHLQVYGPF